MVDNNLKLCRICLIDCCKNVISLDENKYLVQSLELCCGINVYEYGSRFVCGKCCQDLENFVKFKENCAESELYWKSLRCKKESINIKRKTSALDIVKTESPDNKYEQDNDYFDTDFNTKNKVKLESHEKITYQPNKVFKRNLVNRKNYKKSSKEVSLGEQDAEIQFNHCGLCNDVFNDLSLVNEHLQYHWSNNTLICQICAYSGRDFADMVSHRLTHINDLNRSKRKACFVCKARRRDPMGLEFHFRQVHLKKMGGWCHTCGQTFERYKTWQGHDNVHTNTLLECDYCGKGNKSILEDHVIMHMEIKKHVCDECGKQFQKKYGLVLHKNTVHFKSDPIKCTHCDKTYKNPEALRVHMREVTRDKPYSCDICSKRFSMPSALKNHAFFHTGEQPFQCDSCGVKFKTKAALTAHRLKHMGVRKYSCKECSRSFATSTQCRRHMTVHTGVKLYSCACKRGFNCRARLKQHLSTCNATIE